MEQAKSNRGDAGSGMKADWTQAEWMAKGERLFGKDQIQWRFKCPICGHIQTAEDFREYKNHGATPSSAYCKCIGRFNGNGRRDFGTEADSEDTVGCDYASFGLIHLGETVLADDGEITHVFPFAELTPVEKPEAAQ